MEDKFKLTTVNFCNFSIAESNDIEFGCLVQVLVEYITELFSGDHALEHVFPVNWWYENDSIVLRHDERVLEVELSQWE